MEQDMKQKQHNLSTLSFRKRLGFIIKLMIFPVIILLLQLYISPQYTGFYDASIIDKVQRLESVQSPKIVLLGNSNVAFGFNSEEIEEAMGMPVVNMGLHGGMGNAFHEEMGKLNVQPGDIYIVCHDTYDDDDTILRPDLAWITLENHWDLWKILRPKDIWQMIQEYPSYLKKSVTLWASQSGNEKQEGPYSRGEFNEYGDIEWEDHGLETEFSEFSVLVPKISDSVAKRLNDLNTYFEDRGATLLIAGYPIGNGEFTPDVQKFADFQNDLENKLDAEVISDYRDYMFDYKYFYNTNLHLNNQGKELRTQQLILDLEKWQNKSKRSN